MKVIQTHIVARFVQNGPESYKQLVEVFECREVTAEGLPVRVYVMKDGFELIVINNERFERLSTISLTDAQD